MSKLSQLIRGVTSNWVAMASSIIVAFFLSPFVVHHLGNIGYGIWTLTVSITSYMALLDAGLRGAVTRFLARSHSQGDHGSSSRVVSAAIWLRFWMAGFIVLLSLLLGAFASRFFHIPEQFRTESWWAIALVGTSVAMSLLAGVFGGVLAALNRFDLLSAVTIGQTIVRAVGTVLLLQRGHGIVALGVWQLAASIIAGVAFLICSLRVYPQLHLSLRAPQKALIGSLWSYGVYVFIINIGQQVIYYTDNIVVGAVLSAVAVTFYAIGGGLIEYLRQIVSSVCTTFMPLASRFEAEEQHSHLQKLLVHGTQAVMLVVLPIAIALFVRGHTFIGLWMGAQYAQVSGRVLQILVVSTVFAMANSTAGNIAYGIGKHKPLALWIVGEAIANLLLSILLVRHIGMYGVAWGTAIPSLITSIVLWPPYISKLVDLPISTYLYQSWTRPVLACIPYAAACYFTDQFWHPMHLVAFFAQIASILPVFAIGAAVCFSGEIRFLIRQRSTQAQASEQTRAAVQSQ